MAYTLHIEYTDGTFDEKPFWSVSRKEAALRMARAAARRAEPEVSARIIVQQGDTMVRAFAVRQ